MLNESIKSVVSSYLKSLVKNGIPVDYGIVFGSQAKGAAGTWSDIDILIVSPLFDGQRNRDNIKLLWRLAARADSRIEPIPCGARQWLEDDSSAIVEIARREGEMITVQ